MKTLDSKTPESFRRIIEQSGMPAHDNFVDRLLYLNENRGDDISHHYLVDGEDEKIHSTYSDLDARARSIAAELIDRGMQGERALLLFPPGLEFVAALFGCFYAGVVAVPAYPPRRNRNMKRIQAISDDAEAKLALTVHEVTDRVQGLLDEAPNLKKLEWIPTDRIPVSEADRWTRPAEIASDTLAILQYTSGSTGTPKGVMLNHANLVHNAMSITHAFDTQWLDKDDEQVIAGVTWLPSFHDMGLVGGILKPIYFSFPNALMSPMAFLQRPIRWLRAIHNHRAVVSGGPNFAYDLCVEKITDDQCKGLDLSSWQVAFNGAEPVRAATLRRFTEKFAPYGFNDAAHYPCYGMAETTLIVSGRDRKDPLIIQSFDSRALDAAEVVPVEPGGNEARDVVSCGIVLPDEEIAIVDPETNLRLEEEKIGEIWVRSPSVGLGYWRKRSETQLTFKATLADDAEMRPWLRTGDLGFFHKNELFVAGRLKDLIIVRGVNRYPQDIEITVEAASHRLRDNAVAAFSDEIEGRERLIIVCEVARGPRDTQYGDVLTAIRRDVTRQHDLPPDAVILVRSGSMPKTSSGKIQRRACRSAFREGGLHVVADWYIWKTEPEDAAAEEASKSGILRIPRRHGNDAGPDVNPIIVLAVMEQVRNVAQDRARDLDLDTNILVDLGLDSLERMTIVNSLEELFGGRFPDAVLQQVETVREVAAAIDRYIGDRPKTAPIAVVEDKIDEPKFENSQEYLSLRGILEQRDALSAKAANGEASHFAAAEKEVVRFNTSDFLGLSHHPAVVKHAVDAIANYGSSVSASRVVSGEKPVHSELEKLLAKFIGADDSVAFVDGHAACETTVGHLFGPGDLILHDEYADASIIKGSELSGARRREFRHRDLADLSNVLDELRANYRRVLVAVNSLYSSDGSIANLPELTKLRKKHRFFLLVAEHYGLGAIGKTGRGLAEYYGIDPKAIDLTIGSLGNSLGACGGFVAGSPAVVEYLKYTAPGFVFSVGLTPAHAAAAIAAITQLEQNPQLMTQLQENAEQFHKLALANDLTLGSETPSPIITLATADSKSAFLAAELLRARGVVADALTTPLVDDNNAGLRFFITAEHETAQISRAVDAATQAIALANQMAPTVS